MNGLRKLLRGPAREAEIGRTRPWPAASSIGAVSCRVVSERLIEVCFLPGLPESSGDEAAGAEVKQVNAAKKRYKHLKAMNRCVICTATAAGGVWCLSCAAKAKQRRAARRGCSVAGVDAPAFVERGSWPRRSRKIQSVAGVDAPAFVER